MNPLQREGGAYIIVHILTQIQLGAFRSIAFLEGSLHRNFQILETAVTGDGHAAPDLTFHIRGDAVVTDLRAHQNVRPEYLGIAEIFKEPAVGMPLVAAHSRLQINQSDYKGLQSYKKFLSLSILIVAISFSRERIEQNLAYSHVMRGHFHKLVLLDILQSLLK